MNSVILIGNLASDPEKIDLKNGKRLTKLSVAVSSWKKDSEGKPLTNFFKCTAWGKTSEYATNYLKKGNKVAIQGEIELTSWDKPDGTKGNGVNINISNLESVGGKNSKQNTTTSSLVDNISNEDNEVNEVNEVNEEDLPSIDLNDLNVASPF